MQTNLDALLNGSEYRRLFDRNTAEIQKKYGLCKIDLFILNYLSQAKENNTPKHIYELQMFTRGHISQSMKRLGKAGYLRMEVDKHDHRVFHCFVTESWIRLMKQWNQSIESYFDKLVRSK